MVPPSGEWRFVRACLLLALVLWPSVSIGAQEGGEVVAGIRIHGNYTTADADVLRMAGISVGQKAGPDIVSEVRRRLEQTRRFLAVDVRKRYRSLDINPDIALIIIVQEYPVQEAAPTPLRPLRRTLGSAMFMPILNYSDGYGLTYGARVSFVDGLGTGGRLSVPMTWGGTKRVAGEFEKAIDSPVVDRLTATASISRRENPYYRIDDDRRELSVGASRTVAGVLQLYARGGMSSVAFGAIDTRYPFIGAGVTLDTRTDPVFPRNALFASVAWDRLAFRDGPAANRYRIDSRGYVGLAGQTVLSLRAQFARADRTLPPYERYLLGGAASLRGYRTGSFAGDGLAAATAELRIPTSSPLSFARAGVSLFVDTGTVFDAGSALSRSSWHQGYGGGVFLLARIFQLNADVAVRSGGHARLHVTSGFQF